MHWFIAGLIHLQVCLYVIFLPCTMDHWMVARWTSMFHYMDPLFGTHGSKTHRTTSEAHVKSVLLSFAHSIKANVMKNHTLYFAVKAKKVATSLLYQCFSVVVLSILFLQSEMFMLSCLNSMLVNLKWALGDSIQNKCLSKLYCSQWWKQEA